MNKVSLVNISAVAALLITSPLAFAGEKIDKTLSTTASGEVFLDVMNGKVNIKTWDKNEVQIKGELDDKAEGYTFELDGDRVVFEVEMPNRSWGGWGNNWSENGSRLEVWMPTTNRIRFEGVNTDIEVENVTGGAKVNTVNGSIKAAKLSKRVSLETVNGRINTDTVSGDVRLNTVNGKVRDKNSSGELHIETVNGDIETNTDATKITLNNVNGDLNITSDKSTEMDISTVNGDLELFITLAEDGRLVYSSVGGDADIVFKGDVSADFDIETHAGGDISNYITKDKAKEAKYGPSERLRFKAGTGSADVEIDTVSGDIKLKKK